MRALSQLALLAIWVASLWLGYYALDSIEDSYEIACADRTCPPIGNAINLLGLSVLLSAFAVPAVILLLRRQKGRF
jgi:hypothetical protein